MCGGCLGLGSVRVQLTAECIWLSRINVCGVVWSVCVCQVKSMGGREGCVCVCVLV